MRTFGRVRRSNRIWGIECEPHVMIRLKRFFQKIDTRQHDLVILSDTTENCRELKWFIDRYPLEMSPDDRAYLDRRSQEYIDHSERLSDIIEGKFQAREFKMALPPRSYQALAAEATLQGGALLLADDLGLGKTASAICLFTEKMALPALVVTLTSLPEQWKREIQKFIPETRVHIVKKGTPYPLTVEKRGRREVDVPFPDVIVTNYHKLAGWADVLAGKVRTVVFDEIQELRHGGTAKYAGAKHIANGADFKMGLSATPIFNYGSEIYNVLTVLKPLALGTYDEFVREWCNAASMGGNEQHSIKDPKAFGLYMREAGLMLRRTRKDVGRELPALTRVPHHVDADMEALERVGGKAIELAQIILQQGGQKRGEKLRAAEELSWMLRQATGIAKAPYVAEFVRLLVGNGEKVVLYGWHREVYSIWHERLKEFNPVMYTGSESVKQKLEAVERFTKGDSQVLMMSLRAGAGLDGLQGHARTVVFGELDWSPGVHEQCIGRVHRDGQDEPCVAYFLVSDSGSDPVVADVLGLKRQQIEGMRDPAGALIEQLDVGENNIKKLAEAYLKQRGMAAPAPKVVPQPIKMVPRKPPAAAKPQQNELQLLLKKLSKLKEAAD